MLSATLFMLAGLATGQAPEDYTAPPMVPVPSQQAPAAAVTPPGSAAPVPPPPPMPVPEGAAPPPPGAPLAQQPGTPPPPSFTPNRPQSAYPYSPYGQPPRADEKPPVEYGLMISEGLFGMLTAAGVALLPYFLLLRDYVEGGQNGLFAGQDTIGTVIYLIIFAAVPLSVAQTQVSLANGSRWYYSETWPAALTGLVAEAAVLGLAYLARVGELAQDPNCIPGATCQTLQQHQRANPWVLLIGSVAVVPLIQMAAINLFKSPRFGKPGGTSLVNFKQGEGLRAGIPAMAPIFSVSNGQANGVQFSLFNGKF